MLSLDVNVLLLSPRRKDGIVAYHAADLFVFGLNIECLPLSHSP